MPRPRFGLLPWSPRKAQWLTDLLTRLSGQRGRHETPKTPSDDRKAGDSRSDSNDTVQRLA